MPRVAVVGCCHGKLDLIYDALLDRTSQSQITSQSYLADLLLICGDFQAARSENDLSFMSVPPKYKLMGDFRDYFLGHKKAPILTIFIGGNHEASNYMWELRWGGWVTENIWYMGTEGVIRVKSDNDKSGVDSFCLRIGGVSGIYSEHDFRRAELDRSCSQLDLRDYRTVYHYRQASFERLFQLNTDSNTSPIDVFLSHDWPQGIWNYGDLTWLLSKKPFFRQDMQSGKLGSPPLTELLHSLRPRYWFSGHMHCRFEATIQHITSESSHSLSARNGGRKRRTTEFLALDKTIPGRHFIEVVNIDMPLWGRDVQIRLEMDPEWVKILQKQSKSDVVSIEDWTVPPYDRSKSPTQRTRELLKKFAISQEANGWQSPAHLNTSTISNRNDNEEEIKLEL